MAGPIDTPVTGNIWHLSIDDLFAPLPERTRLGGPGPFVINLSVSTAPIDPPPKGFDAGRDVHAYQVQRTEDRRLRYRLRLGPFANEDAADAALEKVRDVYPGALTATADADDLRALAPLQAKAEAQQSLAAAKADLIPTLTVAEPTPVAKAAEPAPVAKAAEPAPPVAKAAEPAPPVLCLVETAAPQIITAPLAPPILRDQVIVPPTTPAPAAAVKPPVAQPVAVKAPVAKPVAVTTAAPAPPVAKPVAVTTAAPAPPAAKPVAVTTAAVKPPAPKPAAPVAAPPAVLDAPSMAGEPEKRILSVESTQTVRALSLLELESEQASRWFVIQLSQSEQAFDSEAVPNLDIFSVYRLYSVAGIDAGRIVHALRLGFFGEEIAAAAVASYLSSFYDKPTVRRVSSAERDRFADQRFEPRKDVGATGKHAVIEITNERYIREKRNISARTVSQNNK